jgi:hypothetical protein
MHSWSFRGTFVPLLNDILHSAWIAGGSPHSIQPDWILCLPSTIKAMHADVDTPPGSFIENDQDRTHYSVDDLADIAEDLAMNHEPFSGYLREVGLIPTRPARSDG